MINGVLASPLTHLKAIFILDEKKYDLENFEMKFVQEADFKGQPESEVKGGQLSFTIPQIADDNLYTWAKKSEMLKSGQILFQTDVGMSILRIEFENAYCVTLTRNISAFGGTQTNLIISAKALSLNGIEYNNRW